MTLNVRAKGKRAGISREGLLQKRTPRKRNGEKIFAYVVVALPLLAFLFFNGVPIIIAFISQFCDIELNDLSTMKWNNFATFKTVFTDPYFYKSLLVTLWVASAQFVSLLTALVISVLLSRKVFGSKLFQILFFIPYICSTIAVSIIWIWMFDTDYGIVNEMLVGLFGEGARVQWTTDVRAYTWQIFMVIVWQAPGYGIVMYKAALGTVDNSLYEAASIDGANAFDKFFKITLPSIAPTTFYLALTGLVAGLLSFDVPKLFADACPQSVGVAGPESIGMTTVLYIYIKGQVNYEMSQASVMSFVMFFITFVLSAIMFKLRNRKL